MSSITTCTTKEGLQKERDFKMIRFDKELRQKRKLL